MLKQNETRDGAFPELGSTPIESIPSAVDELRTTFSTHNAKPIQFGQIQLRKLYWG